MCRWFNSALGHHLKSTADVSIVRELSNGGRASLSGLHAGCFIDRADQAPGIPTIAPTRGQMPHAHDRLFASGSEPMCGTSQIAVETIPSEIVIYGAALREVGIRAD